MEKLISIDDAAAWLGTSPRFVRRLIAERRIAYNKVGRHVRLLPSDLQSFIDNGRVDAAG